MSIGRRQGQQIEFWFDFASSYAYFAAHDLLEMAERRDLRLLWRPYMLGAAFKVTGATGLSSTPLKAAYANHDWQRIARLRDLPFKLHERHPSVTLAAMRVFYWIEQREPERAGLFALAAFNAYFQKQRDLSDISVVTEIAADFGFNPDQVRRGASDENIKQLAREKSEEAISRGVFGSPFFFLDGEPFWGWDRIPLMDEWLERGCW